MHVMKSLPLKFSAFLQNCRCRALLTWTINAVNSSTAAYMPEQNVDGQHSKWFCGRILTTQFFHWSAVNEANPDLILCGILPIPAGTTELTRSWIRSKAPSEINPIVNHALLSMCLADPKNKLFIGSTIGILGQIKISQPSKFCVSTPIFWVLISFGLSGCVLTLWAFYASFQFVVAKCLLKIQSNPYNTYSARKGFLDSMSNRPLHYDPKIHTSFNLLECHMLNTKQHTEPLYLH